MLHEVHDVAEPPFENDPAGQLKQIEPKRYLPAAQESEEHEDAPALDV